MNRIAVALALLPWAVAQTVPNFSGIWELDPSRSTSSGQKPDKMVVKVEHQGNDLTVTFRVTRGGEIQQESQKYLIGQDSKAEMHGAPMTSHAEWDGTTLAVRSRAVIAGKELRLADRWSLSADGNTLTFRERHQYGADSEAEDVHVFSRRPADSWGPDVPSKPAEEVYKNIQVLKGLPAPKLRTTMLNVTAWLGVECAYCHTVPQFEKDDKPAKQTARGMYRMVETLNRDPATAAVTCYTCHRGSAKPQNTPPQ